MATRATYTFKKQTTYKWAERPAVHIYIHYDGYPQGAASYFKGMMDLLNLRNDPNRNLDRGLRGGAAEQFLRANELAEITGHSDNHGDTEFHYEVEESYNRDTFRTDLLLTAYKIDWAPNEERVKTKFFHGVLVEFIEMYPWESLTSASN